MVESSGLLMSRNNAFASVSSATGGGANGSGSGSMGGGAVSGGIVGSGGSGSGNSDGLHRLPTDESHLCVISSPGFFPGVTTTGGSGLIGASRCGVMETRVRGAWYRVLVTLESDYLSVSLDETCDPVDHTTTLNGTLG